MFAVVSDVPVWAWLGFFVLISALIAVDLGVFQRKPHEIRTREALILCGVWISLGLIFNGFVWWWQGAESGQQFLAAYLVELCLSVDNVFIFILVFAYFKVPPRYQHRVLFWGIIGAVIMRAIFILAGVGVITRFHWVLYVFGAFLVYTGFRMMMPHRGEEDINPDRNAAVRLFRRFFNVSESSHEGRLVTVEQGRRVATPLFIVLIVIETTDLIFALDSLPAVLAITTDGFVALTSNIFAILGLRSIYFALSGIMQLIRYLKVGLAIILVFIGAKMLLERWVPISTATSLGFIGGVLALAVLLSVMVKPDRSDTADK